MNHPHVETLMPVVPQTYGEAVVMYPWLKCESHEWDNRTTAENAVWLIRHLEAENERLRDALKITHRYNRLSHDLDAYLYEVVEWGLGNIEQEPNPEDYGLGDEPSKAEGFFIPV